MSSSILFQKDTVFSVAFFFWLQRHVPHDDETYKPYLFGGEIKSSFDWIKYSLKCTSEIYRMQQTASKLINHGPNKPTKSNIFPGPCETYDSLAHFFFKNNWFRVVSYAFIYKVFSKELMHKKGFGNISYPILRSKRSCHDQNIKK